MAESLGAVEERAREDGEAWAVAAASEVLNLGQKTRGLGQRWPTIENIPAENYLPLLVHLFLLI